MQEFDCVVVGGGILGLSVAWTILEKWPACRVAGRRRVERHRAHVCDRRALGDRWAADRAGEIARGDRCGGERAGVAGVE